MEKTKHWWKVEFPHNIPVRKGKIYSPFSPSCYQWKERKQKPAKATLLAKPWLHDYGSVLQLGAL